MTIDGELQRLLKIGDASGRKPRVLRDLKIDEVSSCDVGAGRGVRVVLKKRARPAGDRDALAGTVSGPPRPGKERKMSSSSRCPTCGQKVPDGYDDDMDDTEKRHSLDDVSKGARLSVDSLLDDVRAALGPGASEAEVLKRAADSPLMNQLHVAERNARLKAQGGY